MDQLSDTMPADGSATMTIDARPQFRALLERHGTIAFNVANPTAILALFCRQLPCRSGRHDPVGQQ